MKFRLDATDAIVIVQPYQSVEGYWKWSFSFNDGSFEQGDSGIEKTEQQAKREAYIQYLYQMKIFTKPKRARWLKETE